MKLWKLLSIGFVFSIFAISSFSQSQTDRAGIVDQFDYPDSKNACGPASILNLLKFSREEHFTIYYSLKGEDDTARMKYLIERYFRSRNSTVEPKWNRWGVHGIFAEDLATGLNELLVEHEKPKLKSENLDRIASETEGEHMRRIHEKNLPLDRSWREAHYQPAFIRRKNSRFGKAKMGARAFTTPLLLWKSIKLRGELGFHLLGLDSAGGEEVALFIHRDGGRLPFAALRGAESGSEWLKGFPFLQVMAPEVPSLRPRNLKWADRYLVTANLLIGDF